jgi:pilus assembly protein CpaE
VFVIANKIHASGQIEINRKDFEGSIERKIDFAIPFDQRLGAKAAKLGKPFAEAGKGSKTVQPLVDLATAIMNLGDAGDVAAPSKKKAAAGGGSLMGKFSDLKSMMAKRKK